MVWFFLILLWCMQVRLAALAARESGHRRIEGERFSLLKILCEVILFLRE